MKVKKINEWFEKFGRFEVKHRWGFLICLIIVSIIGSLGLSRLKLDNGEEDWFDDWETTKQIIMKIVELARDLKKTVVCEGVENKAQVEFLNSIN